MLVLEETIKQLMTPKRYIHSLGVEKEAIKLAMHYGADIEKAGIAGLLHDCCKDLSYEQMLALGEKYGVEFDQTTLFEKKLIHAPLGAEYIKNEFEISDDEIYDAVRYHTTGKENMSLLAKIIYIADAIEPNRSYNGIEALRKKVYDDIDGAILDSLNFTVNKLLQNGKLIHPDTLMARNYLILTRGDIYEL